jgi:N-acetylglucosamine repressor
MVSTVDPALLGRMNARRVMEMLHHHGPQSRADVTRRSGVSAPTVSKAVDVLLHARFVEEGEKAPASGLGRPAKVLRLASHSVRVLGIVLDAGTSAVVASGLDGRLEDREVRVFRTPGTYGRLIDRAAHLASELLSERKASTLGLGVSMPGLIDRRTGEGILSPNLHLTDGHAPGRDLAERLGLECVVRQESHALCLAEWLWGAARGLSDFAMLDVSTGLGLGVWSGGNLVEGATGLAGELGHVTLDPRGLPCGCGNHGCLETVATDSALARGVSERLGRPADIDEAIRLFRAGTIRAHDALRHTLDGLAIAVSAVLNIFNPATLLVHGRLLEAEDGLFGQLLERVRRRALAPSFERCRIVEAKGSKRQGALAAVIHHLMDSLGPRLSWPPSP